QQIVPNAQRALATHARVSFTVRCQHRGVDDGGARSSTVVGQRRAAHRRWLLPTCDGWQHLVLSARLHGPVRHVVGVVPAAGDQAFATRLGYPGERMMATIWFWLLALVLAVYAVLDGFDFGVGLLHFVIAKTPAERDTLLRSIGPVWDGNEVWLVAAGGTLFAAFPLLYATAFSGFYLPLIIVLWLLLFRALGIELRHHSDNPLWLQLWDVAFSASSALLAVFFGAALGNLVRGLPLNDRGEFFEPLWTDFRVGEVTGILDWYTLL